MGLPRNTSFCFHLILSLLFLLGSSSTMLIFMAEGRAVFRLITDESAQMGSEEKAIIRAQIGSRPPTCARRCSTCRHCEAVQVPVIPQDKSKSKHFTTDSMRGEYNSNYKPMSWKCKCGDMIFNP